MYLSSRKRRLTLGLWFIVLLAIGCAEGPFAELGAWNPWIRRQWTEDEQHGPTFHARLDELESLRAHATDLSRSEQDRFSQQLVELVRDDPIPLMRAAAVKTLGEFSTPAIFPGLRMAVTDEDPEVRIAACQAWGRQGGAEALQILGDVVRRDADLDVRIAATNELGQFPEQASIEALGVALSERDPALQYRAVQSLKSATGHDFGNSVPAWREFVAGRTPLPERQPSLVERFRRLF